eukprot:gene876-929_t
MILKLKVISGQLELLQPSNDNAFREFISSEAFREQLDELGTLSGVAQELKGPITTYEKLLQSDAQTILIYIDHTTNRIVGYLKYGLRNLYFYLKNGSVKQYENALSLLDFYVLESYQRHGIGKELFESFLQAESVQPNKIAYDRPSRKLLPFLSKHYNLTGPDHQPNRYTIYDGFLA